MFFQKLEINANWDSKQIHHLINQHLKNFNARFTYKHDMNSLKNVLDLVMQNNLIQNFENNLKYYNDQWNKNKENKSFSTLYELITFLKNQ